ncbi:hypothetical protein PFISCL1PPCAC_7315, partial [Pristionchus fissidentatus]
CTKCNKQPIVISYRNSTNVISDFVDYLLLPAHNNAYVMAHYGGRYDHLMLIEEFIKRGIAPDVVMRGLRVISGSVSHNGCTLHLRDTYNLIPLALGNFKKAFGLSGDDKGEFPFLFIEPKNYHTTLKGLPPLKYYNIGSKTPAKREEFLKWYESIPEDCEFNFDEELERYCKNDVELLLNGLIEFRRAILNLTTWDIIPNACTIASFTSFLLRCDHIPPKTLCNVPDSGYRFGRQQSDMAIRWLKWEENKSPGERIQHAANGGELNKLSNQSFGQLYENTRNRIETLKTAYHVIEKWECDLMHELSLNAEMRQFFQDCQISRLNLRLSMQGGRTESHVATAHATEDRRLVYLDFNSLYPTVMVEADMPIGPPTIIRDNFPPVPSTVFPWRGLGHVRILAPSNLRYPVLAVKMNSTLLFALCRKCASTKSTTKCSHSDADRAFNGTWTHCELNKALSVRYIILQYFEIWEYKEFSNTLFANYIKCFHKVKTICSGWPKWVKSNADKQKCLDGYRATMDLDIKPEEIENNPSKRLVAKTLLNASWGKFAENPHVKQTVFCDFDLLRELMRTKLHLMCTHTQIGPDMFIVSLATNPEEVHSSANGNLPLAIFVTSMARLKLYSTLEASAGTALYTDTDSIIALIPRASNPFADMIGDGLGKLTDETPGHEIRRAVFGGPKQYGLELVDKETGKISHVLKIRGLTLDDDASKKITFESLSTLVKMGGSITTERMNLKRKFPYITTVQELK